MRFLKTMIESMFAALLLLLLAPLLLLVAAAIVLEDGRPAMFVQERIGRNGRAFSLFKFRSMRVNRLSVETVGQVTEEHPLVTRVGRWMRRLKIDELPQLINVARGDMSLVGPRPTVREQVERYDPFQRRRLLCRPGLTGWAQVNGNVALSWDERILLDVWYVDHWSPALDLSILGKTLGVIVRGERRNDAALAEAKDYASRTDRRG